MIRKSSNSLVRKITKRMIVVQLVSLALFFGLGVFPVIIYPIISQVGEARTIEPMTFQTLASNLVYLDTGGIGFENTEQMRTLLEENPRLYAYVESAQGDVVTIGDIPPAAKSFVTNLRTVDRLELRTRDRNGRFVVRTESSPIGPVHVLVGNGPTISIISLLRNATILLAFSTWVVLTLVSVFAIPWIVRRELRGLQGLADDAAHISYETRGDRLREQGVPDEILALVRAVNATLDRLDQSYAGRQKFLAAAAHEVRTPIAILQLRLEQSEPFPERQRLLLDVARLATLAEQLLQYQRLGFVKSEPLPVDLSDLAERAVSDMAPLAISSGYELAVAGTDQAVMVEGDDKALYLAVTNLIQNAIAYGGGKGVILVSVSDAPSIAVTDEGDGIPEEARDRIFEPFERLHRSGSGTGLGLNLVYSIMQLHEGNVVVSSSESGGAKFILEFPARDAVVE